MRRRASAWGCYVGDGDPSYLMGSGLVDKRGGEFKNRCLRPPDDLRLAAPNLSDVGLYRSGSLRPSRRRLKQGSSLCSQHVCQFVDHVNGGAINSALKGTDIRAIDIGLMRQCLLGQAASLASLAQVQGEDLSYFHTREANALRCISPRSILDNRHVRFGGA